MKCPKCSKPVESSWKFCKNCGFALNKVTSEKIEIKKSQAEGDFFWGYKIADDGRYQSLKTIKKRLFGRDYKKVDKALWKAGILNGTKTIEGEKAALVSFQLGQHIFIFGNEKGVRSARWRYLTNKKYPSLSKEKIATKDIDRQALVLMKQLGIDRGTKFDNSVGSTIPQSWIDESDLLLKKTLPSVVQNRIFLPESDPATSIYAIYFSHPKDQKTKALHLMAAVLFEWLHIDPKQCLIDFYDEKVILQQSKADVAGLYTRVQENGKNQEVILINSKYRDNGLQVAAILAHELMHLYLHRLNLELEDVRENELLTDLATVRTGLSILVLNGMEYSNSWWLTIILLMFGRLYWSEQQRAFGYYKPFQYGKLASTYLKEQNIPTSEVYGFINPYARHFFPHRFLQKSTKKSWVVKNLLKRKIKVTIFQATLVALVVGGVIWYNVNDSSQPSSYISPQKTQLGVQVDTCKAEIKTMEDTYSSDKTRLNSMKGSMDFYKTNDQVDEYNALVDPYNALLAKMNGEYSSYETALASCNRLVEQYNNSQ